MFKIADIAPLTGCFYFAGVKEREKRILKGKRVGVKSNGKKILNVE